MPRSRFSPYVGSGDARFSSIEFGFLSFWHSVSVFLHQRWRPASEIGFGKGPHFLGGGLLSLSEEEVVEGLIGFERGGAFLQGRAVSVEGGVDISGGFARSAHRYPSFGLDHAVQEIRADRRSLRRPAHQLPIKERRIVNLFPGMGCPRVGAAQHLEHPKIVILIDHLETFRGG